MQAALSHVPKRAKTVTPCAEDEGVCVVDGVLQRDGRICAYVPAEVAGPSCCGSAETASACAGAALGVSREPR